MLEKISETRVFEGTHCQYSHFSKANNCDMRFAIYLPPQSQSGVVPTLFWLSGLTCTDENFMQKAGALKVAAQLGIAIVCPDTSPRGENVADDPNQAYDLGLGAGFYLNAVQQPWSPNYNMYSYLMDELIPLITSEFPVTEKRAISGHSMGGHGALTIGLKNPDLFTSISAFSPICNPINCPWGQKAFTAYLGDDQQSWLQYDACELVEQATQKPPILVDQGSDDQFLQEQLLPENLVKAAMHNDYDIQLNMHTGYDHSYYFISTFIEQHLAFHKQFLD